jgi:2',3'-cyclic-nucleotide 2'-phosphodiesterase (5'-nucleotidase family)
MLLAARRLALTLPLLAALLVLAAGGDAARAGQSPRLTVIFDTHMHGNLSNPADAEVTMAHFAGLVKQRRAVSGSGTLWLGAGDELGGSQISSVFKGAQMIDVFNAAGLDADTIGNHDFDFGPDNLLQQMRSSRFAWLSANVLDRRTGDVFGAEAGAKRFAIVDVAGTRVGITGAAWQFLSSTSAGPNVQVLDAAEALRTVVPQMRTAGAQVVLVMAHLCGDEAERVAAAVNGIDAILGDHCAERLPQPKVINNTIVARRGDEYRYLGELTLRLENGRVAGFFYEDFAVTKDAPQDMAVAGIVASYRSQLDAQLLVPIGATSVALDARNETVRAKESNLANYIADVLRAWGNADIALMNGGGVRGNKEYPAGPLTRGDTITMLPFSNTATLLRISGADLRAGLENGVGMYPNLVGRFPQISGMVFRFDPDAPAGSRVVSVTIGGQPLDPARMYTLATADFLANGGDDYVSFKNAQVVIPPQAGPLLYDLLADAIQREGTIAPMTEGRIVIGR